MLIGVKLHSLKIEDRFQGPVGPSCQYIARSLISSRTFNLDPTDSGNSKSSIAMDGGASEDEDDENFDDALQEFGRESPDQSPSTSFHHLSSAELGLSYSPSQGLPHWGLDSLSAIKAKALLEEIFSQRKDVEVSDFVKVQLTFRHKESDDYNGVDTQVVISDVKCFTSLVYVMSSLFPVTL
jgi:hypothetical protein